MISNGIIYPSSSSSLPPASPPPPGALEASEGMVSSFAAMPFEPAPTAGATLAAKRPRLHISIPPRETTAALDSEVLSTSDEEHGGSSSESPCTPPPPASSAVRQPPGAPGAKRRREEEEAEARVAAPASPAWSEVGTPDAEGEKSWPESPPPIMRKANILALQNGIDAGWLPPLRLR